MNVFKLSDFSCEEINAILDLAEEFKNGKQVDYHRQKSVAFLFFENSTRTHYSFEKAALNLGCVTQNFEAATSSVCRRGNHFTILLSSSNALGMT